MATDIHLEVARVIRDQSPISRAGIARILRNSPSTVGRAVDQLVARGIIHEVGQSAGEGAGRPSRLLDFSPDAGHVLTVDLRLTEAHAAITDLGGRVLHRAMRDIGTGGGEASVAELLDTAASLLERADLATPVSAVVVGVPSLVDAASGVVEWAPSLGWKALALQDIMEQALGLPVMLENDVNLAALGEYWKGAGHTTKKNLVFVSVGTGIGAGIIIDGELYRGATHAAGEVAYFITDVRALRDDALQVADLEHRVGREGLIRTAQLVAQRYPGSLLADALHEKKEQFRTRDILQLARSGDKAALVVVNELVEILTIVTGNIAVFMDPEMIVLGGPNDWQWDFLIDQIQAQFGSSLLRPVNLQPSQLGSDAVIVGGAYVALPHVI